MTEPKRPLKVFLCHAHADRDAVRALYTRLTNDGVDAWLDKEKLLGGQNWRMEIRAAVEEADVVVVCHSKEFNKEGFRQREVKWALDAAMEKPEGTIFIIPARLEECKVIKSLSDWHWVDLFESNGYDMLMRALRARANNIGATLQIKRSWLPKIATPLPKKQKPIENKVIEISDEKIIDNVDNMPPSPELPDGWEAQWQAAFVKNAKEEKEKLLSEKREDKPVKPKIGGQIAYWFGGFIVLVLGIILLSLFNPAFTPQPTPENIPTQTVISLGQDSVEPNETATLKSPAITTTVTQTADTLGETKVSLKDDAVIVFIPASENAHSFWIDQEAISTSMFSKFIDDTGYVTETEINNIGYVWTFLGELPATQFPGQVGVAFEWQIKSGVNWKYPPGYDGYSGNEVLQITWNDAFEYCKWAERELLSEQEWQLAKDSGLPVKFYIDEMLGEWGNDRTTGIYRSVLGRDYIKWGGYTTYLFQERGFAENRSADRLTFRCKEKSP